MIILIRINDIIIISFKSQDLALQQGTSQLQTASTDLWTLLVNITSPLRIHFPLLNPTELRPSIIFSLVLVLVLD
jgi:hypothetical protein